MKQTAPTPDYGPRPLAESSWYKNHKTAVWSAIGIGSVVLILCGPNSWQSYQDARDIKAKSGPAGSYVTGAFDRVTLDGTVLSKQIGGHQCSTGAQILAVDFPRDCHIRGNVKYLLNPTFEDYLSARHYVKDVLQEDGIKETDDEASRMATVNGQTIRTGVAVTVDDSVAYNNRPKFEHQPGDPVLSPGQYVVNLEITGYTVWRPEIDYPYNNDGP